MHSGLISHIMEYMTLNRNLHALIATTLLLQASALRAGESLEAAKASSRLPALQLRWFSSGEVPEAILAGKPVGAAESADSEAVYEKLYAAGRAPQAAEIQGNWRGSALVFARQKPLPSLPLLNLVIEAVSLKFWDGKTFSGAGGANRLLGGRLKLFGFTTEIRPSRTGTGEALALDYGSNPYPVSAIRDEVRQIAERRLLGRAYLHAPDGKDHFLFYFMLAKEDE